MKAALVLETGKIFIGESFGAKKEVRGEVVFYTGMTGYQELLTDPSSFGQIVCMTYPLIGNYGINQYDNQSAYMQVRGLIVKEAAEGPNHWQMKCLLAEELEAEGIPGIKGIDTRALTRHIRDYGALKGMITCDLSHLEDAVSEIKGWQNKEQPVAEVSTPHIYSLSPLAPEAKGRYFKLVVLDFGIKNNILKALRSKGFEVTVVPYHTSAHVILSLGPDAIFLSNGPGNPKNLPESIATIKELIGRKPIFGVGLGHQLLALALGGDTYKLKFGHRGGNQPVLDLNSSKVIITSQNHSYAVAADSLEKTPLVVTHLNVNDKTVEGMRHKELPVFSVQYHPEDSLYLFDDFAAMIDG
ncbi:MAG: glutamine-hydrolyzing carbamoyl-phosphate synthase small subunit [Peptococcaceae bacterium]|nr:glutamine-hydrolyzing carbamoyl-phosphate synthase small subunit [Peptococcaceae bacterium]